MLTGQNGILTQAQNAKTSTEQASIKEKLELAVTGAMASPDTMTAENLKSELANYDIPTESSKFPVIVNVNDKNFAINSSGDIMEYKNMTDITGEETDNTVTKDNLDNYLVVPAGFKILNTSDNVTDGIIIEDTRYENTKGSQFVWIPVGDINTTDKGTINIELKRYVFNNDGTVNEEFSQPEPGNQLKISSSSSVYFTEGLKDSITTNTHAKDIKNFVRKAKSNHGYYIGRYEARDKAATAERTSSSGTINQLVCTANNYIYNYVTQPQAATLSRNMYTSTLFESDLINSYAWDTATIFLQTIDNRTTDKTTKYSRQNSLNTSAANQGTNKLTDTSKQDKICNIYDMASNYNEWSTETSSNSTLPCTRRGGNCNYNNYLTSSRYASYATDSYYDYSFRPILYL